ncbi:hypothetical protein F2Q68_00030471 [Brassica cretica]|uniref:Uncharacterized protein n=1 Tax=Brassica cretica TaxID=69181 RepID=A0A8S9GBS3_BRACR|nr:hypothetical protein F2Q68_00030471 [Brassica cretica]
MSKRSASFVPTEADRARSKRRMDSPVSRSDSSSEPGEGSDCDLMAPLPLSCVYTAPPLVGPASSVGEDELAECRSRYLLPSSLNPPAWRILIAIQNLGDLEYLSLGINEVMFAYHMAPLNGGEGRFHLFHRSGLPIVEELPKTGTHPAPEEGERAVLRARQLRVDRRQMNFLVSKMVLRRSSLWRDMSGDITNDTFAAYQEAAKVMSVKKGSSSRSPSGDEVMITGSRRSTVVKLEPSPSLRGKGPKSGGVTTRSM